MSIDRFGRQSPVVSETDATLDLNSMEWGGWRRDFHSAAVWSGLTAFVWYAFGAVPLQIAVAGQLGLTGAQTSSWIFIVWFCGALISIALSFSVRQPIAITWTLPGLMYLGTLAGEYSFAELVGANLVAGLLILLLGVFGVGSRMMRWLPLPIVMGMFGGSILEYATRAVSATVTDVAVAGATVGGYLLARVLPNQRVPPVGMAVIGGVVAIVLTDQWTGTSVAWSLPTPRLAAIAFTPATFVSVSVPLAVLAMGLGNVQGLGFLIAQGYRVPVNLVSVMVGIGSVVNALFGGHPATVGRIGVAILGAPDAGPLRSRYWGNVIAASLVIVLALAAVPVASLLTVLPQSFVFALAGVAIISSLQDAIERSFGSDLRFGPLLAFIVAATPFSVANITSAFWAIVVGVCGSFIAERRRLLEFWRSQTNESAF